MENLDGGVSFEPKDKALHSITIETINKDNQDIIKFFQQFAAEKKLAVHVIPLDPNGQMTQIELHGQGIYVNVLNAFKANSFDTLLFSDLKNQDNKSTIDALASDLTQKAEKTYGLIVAVNY